MTTSESYCKLGKAIVWELLKWYCEKGTSKATRKAIIKDLRSDYLDQFSDGMALVVAEHLEKNSKEIIERVRKEKNEELKEEK